MIRRIVSKIRHRFGPDEIPKKIAPEDSSLFISNNVKYDGYEMGEWSYGQPEVLTWGAGATLKIGKFCSIAPKVAVMLVSNHNTHSVTTYPFDALFSFLDGGNFEGKAYTKGDVVIGNDVWVGWGALLLSGIEIGDGAVVAAHSVVTKNVEPYSIVAGNPARHVKYRFPPGTVQALQRIAWWHWPSSKIRDVWPLLSTDVQRFVSEFDESV